MRQELVDARKPFQPSGGWLNCVGDRWRSEVGNPPKCRWAGRQLCPGGPTNL